jgi:hypothetical protein
MEDKTQHMTKQIKRTVYLTADLDDASLWKTAAGILDRVVKQFRGEGITSTHLFKRTTIKSVFPHRIDLRERMSVADFSIPEFPDRGDRSKGSKGAGGLRP